MIPHERSLVAKLEGKPFALIGVNTDKGDVSSQIKDSKVTWRSFKDSNSAISQSLGITGFPSLFLIDEKGIVLKSWVGAPSNSVLEEAIEKALASMN